MKVESCDSRDALTLAARSVFSKVKAVRCRRGAVVASSGTPFAEIVQHGAGSSDLLPDASLEASLAFYGVTVIVLFQPFVVPGVTIGFLAQWFLQVCGSYSHITDDLRRAHYEGSSCAMQEGWGFVQ